MRKRLKNHCSSHLLLLSSLICLCIHSNMVHLDPTHLVCSYWQTHLKDNRFQWMGMRMSFECYSGGQDSQRIKTHCTFQSVPNWTDLKCSANLFCETFMLFFSQFPVTLIIKFGQDIWKNLRLSKIFFFGCIFPLNNTGLIFSTQMLVWDSWVKMLGWFDPIWIDNYS